MSWGLSRSPVASRESPAQSVFDGCRLGAARRGRYVNDSNMTSRRGAHPSHQLTRESVPIRNTTKVPQRRDCPLLSLDCSRHRATRSMPSRCTRQGQRIVARLMHARSSSPCLTFAAKQEPFRHKPFVLRPIEFASMIVAPATRSGGGRILCTKKREKNHSIVPPVKKISACPNQNTIFVAT